MTKIDTIYHTKTGPVLSFEIYPPHPTRRRALYAALANLEPKKAGVDFISVTYGAGGQNNQLQTHDIAETIQNDWGIPVLHHLTGINQTPNRLQQLLEKISTTGIENILAVRGDVSELSQGTHDFPFAKDLIQAISKTQQFCVGAAIYPEGHVDNPATGINIEGVKSKMHAGTKFLISQLFFDNQAFYRMQETLSSQGIHLPVSAGIAPIISPQHVEKLTYMTRSSLPAQLTKLIHKYQHDPAGFRQAGMTYALKQVYDLIDHGVDGIHIYAMNQQDVLTTMIPKINQYIQNKKTDGLSPKENKHA